MALVMLTVLAATADADTVVRFDTSLGSFYVQLYDTDTPGTVQNFLNYVADGDYTNSFFHRLATGFVLQGGGFYYDAATDQILAVPTDAPITNEFLHSNLRGTVAMAKQGGDPDSATSQFFFSLDDNSANLDNQNGGFTVFGHVMRNGMGIVDLLAGVEPNPAKVAVWNASGFNSAFDSLPLIDFVNDGRSFEPTLEMVNGVTVVADPSAPPQWKLTGGGSYNDALNWTYDPVPNDVGAEANLVGRLTAPGTVTVDSPVTVGSINFDNANAYTLAGQAPVTLQASAGNAQINVLQGHHTISAPLVVPGGVTVDTAAGTVLTFQPANNVGLVAADVTKDGPGTLLIQEGLLLAGNVTVNEGLFEVGKDVLSPGGGANTIYLGEGTLLRASGTVNHQVHNTGAPGTSTLQAGGAMAVGVLDDPNGYDFPGHLEVGPHAVGLRDADKAHVYSTHLGGGSLSSFNGIGIQPVDVFGPSFFTHEGWVTGHGTIHGAVRLETDVVTGEMAAIAGDGPDAMIVLDGIVGGSGWFEYVKITGLHRPGASAGATSLGPGFDIGPSTAMGIDGPVGFDLPDASQNPQRGYDQWFAAMGEHSIGGDLTIALEEGFIPGPGDRFEIFKSFAPGGNSTLIGWYVDWFSNVTLEGAWPTPEEWVWEFQYKDGANSHGDAPEAGREFLSASLMVVPEPASLVLLISGGLCLLACAWRKRGRR